MNRKRIAIAIIMAIAVIGMLVAGYLMKHREAAAQPEPESIHITADEDDGVGVSLKTKRPPGVMPGGQLCNTKKYR